MNTPKSREIAVRYLWTKEELRNAYKCERNASVRPVIWWIFAGVMVMLLVGSVAEVVMEGFISWGSFDLALWLALVVPLLGNVRAAMHFRKHKDLNAELSWSVTPEGLECRVGGEVKHRFYWSDVRKVTEGKRGVLLYPARSTFYWFPYHAFSTPEDLNRFLKYALVCTEAELYHA